MLTEQLEQIEEGVLEASNGVVHLPHGGGTIRALPAPPSDFDPSRASAKELRAHGLPARPDDPQKLDLWQEIVRCKRIEPVFRWLGEGRGAAPLTLSSTIVAGVIAPPSGSYLGKVEASWTVPNVYPPAGAVDGTWYSASTWIGLSDNASQLKAGVQCRVVSSFGSVARQFFPFWEWSALGKVQVISLSVMPGDLVYGTLSIDASTSAIITLFNLTAGTNTGFEVALGSRLPNELANWLVEALAINSPNVALARFGRVYFDNATSFAAAGAEIPAGTGDVVDMFASGAEIAYGRILGPRMVYAAYGPDPAAGI
jgi:Peptidase A4 family